jgi:DNA-binding LacI/PurR family transcriptional regulator
MDDLRENFDAGGRYRSVRNIAGTFEVSQQTAQRLVSSLAEKGYLEVRERKGIYLPHNRGRRDIRGEVVLLASSNGDPRFNRAFLDGVREVTGPASVGVVMWVDSLADHGTIAFGERMVRKCKETNATGIIALAFRGAELAFYHVGQRRYPLVSDVDSTSMPSLPSVQTDNHRHAREAARTFAGLGKTDVCVAGYWTENNVRHTSFAEEIARTAPAARVRYVCLVEETSTADLYIFFRNFSKTSAIFTTDYAANHTVAPYFVSHRITPDDCFMVYDSETDFFHYDGLPPIRAAAPSLSAIGTRLAQKLLHRMAEGEWSEPLDDWI